MVLEKFPYNGREVISLERNTGSIGCIIASDQPDPNICFSLNLYIEDPDNDENLSRRINALKNGISIER